MPLPRLTPDELVLELRELARASFADTFPNLDMDDTIEADAAAFVEAATRILRSIADEGGPWSERARAVVDRLS